MEDAEYLKTLLKRARGETKDDKPTPDNTKDKTKGYSLTANDSQIESASKLQAEDKMRQAFIELSNSPELASSAVQNESDKLNILELFETLRDKTIDGDKKRLIRFEDKNENILKLLQPFFSVDVTVFVNYIVSDYFDKHPELIAEIKKSIKSIDI